MGLSDDNLIRCEKKVRVVGGFKLVCKKGWVLIKLSLEKRRTNEALYICNGIKRLYLDKESCISLNILSPRILSGNDYN